MKDRLFDKHKLLVEGVDEKLFISNFLDAHIEWGNDERDWLVNLKDFGGVTKMLKANVFNTELKTPGLKALGVIVDADDSPEGRWQRIQTLCQGFFPDLPSSIPTKGLIVTNGGGLRLGVWIMPDNKSPGMLETLLYSMVADTSETFWTFARETVEKAGDMKDSFRECHREKAHLHTWLALKDPPGERFHHAVAHSAEAAPFVEWFIKLYNAGHLRRDKK